MTATGVERSDTQSTSSSRKRSVKRFVRGPRQPRLSEGKDRDRPLSHVDERSEMGAEDSSANPKGAGMMVDLDAVARVDMTAVRVEAMHEFMMYLAQLVRESGVIAREQLRLTMLSRGDEVNLPHTPALDGGFLPGPASRLLGIAQGTPMETAPPPAPAPSPSPSPARSESCHSEPLPAPTPVMGTINDHARLLEDIVEPKPAPPPESQLPDTYRRSPAVSTHSRVPSAMPYDPAPLSAPAMLSTPAVATRAPASKPTTPVYHTQSFPPDNSHMLYPANNGYAGGTRYPSFGNAPTSYPQSSSYAAAPAATQSYTSPSYAGPHSDHTSPAGPSMLPAHASYASPTAQQPSKRASWSPYSTGPTTTTAAAYTSPQHASFPSNDATRATPYSSGLYPPQPPTAATGTMYGAQPTVPRGYDRSGVYLPPLGSYVSAQGGGAANSWSRPG